MIHFTAQLLDRDRVPLLLHRVRATAGRHTDTAEARRRDVDVGIGERGRQLCFEPRGLAVAAQTLQALVVAVQRPHIVGVLVHAARRGRQAQVLRVRVRRLLDKPLLERQRRERVPRRQHPAPGLRKRQRVLERHGIAQPAKGHRVVGAPVRNLAVQHGRGNVQDVCDLVGEVEPCGRHVRRGRAEPRARRLGLGHPAGRRIGNGVAVVPEHVGHAVQVPVGLGLEPQHLVPPPEADQHVHAHRQEKLHPVGQRGRLDAQHRFGDCRLHAVRRLERRLRHAAQHRRVNQRVVVVQPVVAVKRAPAVARRRKVLVVGHRRPVVVLHRAPVVAHQHVNVRRHVVRVARVRHQITDHVRCRQRRGRGRRHFHQVDVVVRHARVRLDARARQGSLEERAHLGDRRTGNRSARRRVKEFPRRHVHQRVGKERDHVEVGVVATELGVHSAHGVCIGAVAHGRVACRLCICECVVDGLSPVGVVEQAPGAVVVGARAEGEAPVGHGAGIVVCEHLSVARNGLVVVEAVGPDEGAAEPNLGFRRRRGHMRCGGRRPAQVVVGFGGGAGLDFGRRCGGPRRRVGEKPLAVLANVALDARLDPLARGDADGRLVVVGVVAQPRQHGALHGPQLERVLGAQKVEHAEAVNVRLVGRRGDDAVDAALQEAVGQKLQRVGHVDRDAAVERLDPAPAAVGAAHLQGGDGLAEQEREAPKVGVALDPDVVELGVVGGAAVVVLHVAQVAVGQLVVAVVGGQGVLGQLEDQGKEHEQLADDVVVDVAGKVLNLGPVGRDHGRMGPLGVGGDELGDVVDFRVVGDAGRHLAQAQRLVAVVAAVLEVGALKHRLANGKLAVDLLLAQAKVDNVEEADGLDGGLELLGQGLFAAGLVERRQVERGKLGPFDWGEARERSVCIDRMAIATKGVKGA
ncbi:hypothetical protein SPBR_08101 [Sporothrix brasiliensis 5110]|uniref:Uncharacterized protein n=1 Tax=Sporothrix brasiliensis 5110 TaxID=1398154 RepID=A0A0C2IIP6_9PEZI|nr:uncharacterized protein SPBR_08101 [Sporothrix brasiliensis 5110]KIH86865.1 hypothetical protein SPBR_08101 [Sporothrix brasiliensis 5110]